MRYIVGFLLVFLSLCMGEEVRVAHETRNSHGDMWIKGERIDPNARLLLRIGLKQSNLEDADSLIHNVSHPSSPGYGKHYSRQDIVELFAPSNDTVETVRSWILRHGGSSALSRDRGWLHANMSVVEAESMLNASYYKYHHTLQDYSTTSCEEYYVPSTVRPHIDFVTPGVMLLAPKQPHINKKVKRQEPPIFQPDSTSPPSTGTSKCGDAVTPDCIRKLYNIPKNTLNHSSNSLGIFETGDYYAQEDLDMFFGKFAPNIPKGTHPHLVSIDGGSAPVKPAEADGESDLDMQVAYPLIYPQSITLYQTDDKVYTVNGAGGLFNNFLNAIDGSYCSYKAFGEKGNDPSFDDVYPDTQPGGYTGKTQCGISKPTNVISISYSKSESDLPFYYQQRQCNEFMKLALQGHTVLVASGDAGVAARSWDPEPNGCLGLNNTVFNPNFPGNCPYVTVVGGTRLPAGAPATEPEVAAYLPHQDGSDSTYTSGGGFSTIYSIPSYQKAALDKYYMHHDPGYKYFSALYNATHNGTVPIGANGGIYNRIGRGMPDVSAISQDIATYVGGEYGLISGTSAATPLFASIVTLINEQRLKAGKGPVGFINPVMYQNPQVFNDITKGNNEGCDTKGFSAVPGWDPVTGLGTPRYPEMLKLFMDLP
ncbi:peptidase S8/S53 domain-containing protein [Fusarium oxysporum f. sp. albedinis]|nr:peptidase S8/S53 domain-containing protein [Fusarium oxysporum f. sp. albedinis]KAJ0143757.1 FAD-dependent monooxygenase bik2 [Fusarium oxysporum f. sp. albedinis]KAK2474966.1 hypothetical protein H9L39_12559 [Fusarium oxysporum f. sp. albedinis]